MTEMLGLQAFAAIIVLAHIFGFAIAFSLQRRGSVCRLARRSRPYRLLRALYFGGGDGDR
jgi:hypothetical protein